MRFKISSFVFVSALLFYSLSFAAENPDIVKAKSNAFVIALGSLCPDCQKALKNYIDYKSCHKKSVSDYTAEELAQTMQEDPEYTTVLSALQISEEEYWNALKKLENNCNK